MNKFDLDFEIRIRHIWSNFVHRRIYFEIRPSLAGGILAIFDLNILP